MAPALYMVWASPPVRAVLMTAKSLDLDLDLKEIDLIKGEHKTPQFLKVSLTSVSSQTKILLDQPPTHRPHAGRG
jgi:hypothetical protein